ncbi:hypothetical protein [Polyangium sp. 15x6]|uniref:hypothetical protein n=1 Tax=Polyangium sp. 15x6 TaxID=3042687 RepID=UPI00249B9158|nr:hypothetical protein [Polyangium sp. 15x6]MDI3286947.1 hypothetical protein [Polyangium sp. 15x6]
MPSHLRAAFVRVPGQRDRIYVHRSNGTEVSWVFPTYGDELPHDLVHIVVEAAFGLKKGFWGRVDAGLDPARINDEANRKGGGSKYAGFGDDLEELLLAEGLAGAPWSDAEVSDAAILEVIASNCARAGVEAGAVLTTDRVREVRRVLPRLREQWRAFAGKGTITLVFDPQDPARGFAELLRA